mmetsp:Transcript_7742/g.21160  ORF Transcript_7742/g.21160 Transcript_7742/m.21160 type:complete len:202 (-) Transcript_7742:82-687(-)
MHWYSVTRAHHHSICEPPILEQAASHTGHGVHAFLADGLGRHGEDRIPPLQKHTRIVVAGRECVGASATRIVTRQRQHPVVEGERETLPAGVETGEAVFILIAPERVRNVDETALTEVILQEPGKQFPRLLLARRAEFPAQRLSNVAPGDAHDVLLGTADQLDDRIKIPRVRHIEDRHIIEVLQFRLLIIARETLEESVSG